MAMKNAMAEKAAMKKFKTEVVLSMTTGVLLCNFGEMQEMAEYLTGGPVFTHQFAHKPFWEEIKDGIIAQHPAIGDVDHSSVTKNNWEEFRDRQIATLGDTVELAPLAEIKTLRAAFTEPLKGKEVLVVKV